jgi:hypothetical protein
MEYNRQTLEKVYKFFDDTYELFKYNNTTNYKELSKDFPHNLKTEAKIKFAKKNFEENITEEDFVELLCHNTYSADFVNLYYLIKYFQLEKDDNGMIIFNDVFSYGSIKQEALFIWWIVDMVYNHPMFSKYTNKLLSFSLEKRLEINILPTNDNFRYDQIFNNLNLAIEVNEKHHEKELTKRNDKIKKSLCKLHGIVLKPINIVQIIPNYVEADFDRDIIENIYNSEYLANYKKEYLNLLLSSMLSNFKFRQDYITKIFIESIIDFQIDSIEFVKKDNNLYNITNELKMTKDDFNKYNNVLTKFTHNSEDFIKLFEFKLKSLENNKIIKLLDIVKLCNITDDYLSQFIRLSCNSCKIINNSNTDNILLSWFDINTILFNEHIDIFRELRNILQIYYRYIDTIYETIIRRMKWFNDLNKSSSADFYKYQYRISRKINNKIKSAKEEAVRIINEFKLKQPTLRSIIQSINDIKIFELHNNDVDIPENPLSLSFDLDLEQISRTDINNRIDKINNEFEVVYKDIHDKLESKLLTNSEIIKDFDTEPESESDFDSSDDEL